ncbi:helix-turn-helix domain-containing protein [Novispirillum sp. DQ9]|uniref:helix-turn-helix domain-containing protein n=1 Tax=Novispirillum sp. DQ9 TaxID=3398612 RepID=UPI003C79B73D
MAPPVPIGHRIRALRQDCAMTQVALAAAVGISSSYLNLIEHNRRPIGGALLLRIAAELGTNADQLAGREEARMAAELEEMAADPTLAAALPASAIPQMVGQAPELARAALGAYRAYREARLQGEALAERLSQDPFLAEASHQILTLITSIRSFSEILEDYGDMDDAQRRRFIGGIADESRRLAALSGEMFDFLGGRATHRPHQTPEEEVDDLFHDRANYFPELEDAADHIRRALLGGEVGLFATLAEALRRRHGVTVRFASPESLPREHAYDPDRRVLALSEALTPSSWRFRAAQLIGRLEAAETIDALAADPILTTDAARDRARHALGNAFAGALLLPRAEFLAAARTLRTDIERLQERFTASFEQVCHRLASLSRAPEGGESGGGGAPIPFHFLRTDIAGNISKRFSASGLRLPRYTGACPRWVTHTAFLTPGRIVTQVARLPEGGTFLFIAKAFARPGGGWRTARTYHSVTLGCDFAFARQTVYADGLDPGVPGVAEPVGVSCRQCPRADCAQRALPALEVAGGAE